MSEDVDQSSVQMQAGRKRLRCQKSFEGIGNGVLKVGEAVDEVGKGLRVVVRETLAILEALVLFLILVRF